METSAERVGIRELRQNLSVYLERVKEGETLEVTDRGRSVAMLVPLPGEAGVLDRLVAAGRARPARGSIRDVIPPEGEPTDRASRALQQQRADRL